MFGYVLLDVEYCSVVSNICLKVLSSHGLPVKSRGGFSQKVCLLLGDPKTKHDNGAPAISFGHMSDGGHQGGHPR